MSEVDRAQMDSDWRPSVIMTMAYRRGIILIWTVMSAVVIIASFSNKAESGIVALVACALVGRFACVPMLNWMFGPGGSRTREKLTEAAAMEAATEADEPPPPSARSAS